MSQDYEAELTATRDEVAAVLSGVTDGVLAGSIRLGDGADAVSVDVPDDEAGAPDGSSDADAALPPADDPLPVGAADSGSLARFELFRDRAAEWRWRLRHRNGNVIATSGEGYTRKHNAQKGLRSVVANAPGADLTEE